MQNKVSTPNRLTVMLPVVPSRMENLHKEGQQLVHNIMVRKGNTYLKYPNGRLRPVAQAIFNKNLVRLRANEEPANIIRDMQAQLQLL